MARLGPTTAIYCHLWMDGFGLTFWVEKTSRGYFVTSRSHLLDSIVPATNDNRRRA